MGKILVGTSSWTDPTLIASGKFYPAAAKPPEARLRYYSSQFSLVEVDSIYYSLLEQRASVLWAVRTPSDFVFDIKAFRLFTQHPTPVKVLPADIKQDLSVQQKGKTNLYLKELPIELAERSIAGLNRPSYPFIRRLSLERFWSNFPPGFSQGLNGKSTSCRWKRS